MRVIPSVQVLSINIRNPDSIIQNPNIRIFKYPDIIRNSDLEMVQKSKFHKHNFVTPGFSIFYSLTVKVICELNLSVMNEYNEFNS